MRRGAALKPASLGGLENADMAYGLAIKLNCILIHT
jgi:hypothetical protein